LVVRQEDFLDRSRALEAASPGVYPTSRDAA
jgi:hypothetical protein